MRINRSRAPIHLRLESLEPRDVPVNPSVLDPNLAVRTAVDGLNQPTGIAFLGASDFLVTEKATGQVKRVTNGAVAGTVLDLAVNSGSERGLLGIELHPNFRRNGWVYLYWTESTTGADTAVLNETPVLGNRVDRFIWNGTSLNHDRIIIKLRAIQEDPTNATPANPLGERGNHDGGKIKFGHDGKLYVMIGDVGRRGQMQNLPDGPFGNGRPDDPLGGPEPDNEHLTGVILRLNADGSTPRDNPFFRAGAEMGGEVGANLQKVFAYGLRNGFGMAFDPYSGRLWDAQNGDDAFSEINRVDEGANLGWVQVMGPVDRVAEFKAIETSNDIDPVTGTKYFGLQQNRWSPENIADTPEEALARMFQVVEGAKRFDARLTGAEEVPPVSSTASADLDLRLNHDGTLRFKLKARGDITDMMAAHLHLGARGQNGAIAVGLAEFATPQDFERGDTIAEGVLSDAEVRELPGFIGTVSELVARMRQGRIYTNLHTVAHPSGEIRGQVEPRGKEVSEYVDPALSWKFEVAPVALGFQKGRGLGRAYEGDMFVGEARDFLEGGFLFRMDLSNNRKNLRFTDPRLADKVADNKFKFDIAESESLLFGRNFGVAAEVMTGKNGNLFVVSLSDGAVYEIFRPGGNGRSDMTGFGRKNDDGGERIVSTPAPVRVGVPRSDDATARDVDRRSPDAEPAAVAELPRAKLAAFDFSFVDPIEV